MTSFERQCFLGWACGCVLVDVVAYTTGVSPWSFLAGNSVALVATAFVCLIERKAAK